MTTQIAVLAGDGIGPEVIAAAVAVMRAAALRSGRELCFAHAPFGGAAIDACGDPLPAETLETCRKSHGVLLGAVGGPKWDQAAQRPEGGLLALRKELGVFANLRPVSVAPGMERYSPLKVEIIRGADILIVRELTGGIYFGRRGRDGHGAFDTATYTREEIARVARVAFEQARLKRRRLTSVDKANVLETSRLWRETVSEVGRDFPDVELAHMLVDSAAAALVCNPRRFDVLLTENMFGDILSDQAAGLCGSLGLLPSASLGSGGLGLFEPVHGSAPDIAGRGIANPVGAILSGAMLFRLNLRWEREAAAIEQATARAMAKGRLTADLDPDKACTTEEFTKAVLRELESANA